MPFFVKKCYKKYYKINKKIRRMNDKQISYLCIIYYVSYLYYYRDDLMYVGTRKRQLKIISGIV